MSKKNSAQPQDPVSDWTGLPARLAEESTRWSWMWLDGFRMLQHSLLGVTNYSLDFLLPASRSVAYLARWEAEKSSQSSLSEIRQSYAGLAMFNAELLRRGFEGSAETAGDFGAEQMKQLMAAACCGSPGAEGGEDLPAYVRRMANLMETVSVRYPRAIREIAPEFGFHFERGECGERVAETGRFVLYQVLPNDPEVGVRNDGKPVLIIPPYVLGADILAFLPGERKSYAHSFANQGVPVYIRVPKDIGENEPVQVMTGEDDAADTALFCDRIRRRHGRMVTLNGYCQGGFTAVINLLSGELDGLVDALITCVAPIEGTRSPRLGAFLRSMPGRFNDLGLAEKTLPSGNRVVDGEIMSWLYKIGSIEEGSPAVSMLRDLAMFEMQKQMRPNISKTAAALNYWLTCRRHDLPLEVIRLSFESYRTPISEDGTMPVTLFGRRLNLNRIEEMGIKWLICYGAKDELVERESALAPRNHVDAEIAEFPKGHVGIAVSWSHPASECALHTRFGEESYRGPVRFQLDLEAGSK